MALENAPFFDAFGLGYSIVKLVIYLSIRTNRGNGLDTSEESFYFRYIILRFSIAVLLFNTAFLAYELVFMMSNGGSVTLMLSLMALLIAEGVFLLQRLKNNDSTVNVDFTKDPSKIMLKACFMTLASIFFSCAIVFSRLF